jgi:hypothetical protein
LSNTLLNLVFADRHLKGLERTMMLALAYNISDACGYGKCLVIALYSDANIDPRQADRVLDQLVLDGVLYYAPIIEFDWPLHYLITLHLSETEIADGLAHYFKMPPFDAEVTAEDILKQRTAFFRGPVLGRSNEDERRHAMTPLNVEEWTERQPVGGDTIGNGSPSPLGAEGCVYVIRAPNDIYKIGKSNNVPRRFKRFEVKLPFDIDLIHVIACSDYHKAERRLHEQFAGKRVAGEWFALDEADVAYLKSLERLDLE